MVSSTKPAKQISIDIEEGDNEYEIIDRSRVPEEYKEQAKAEKLYNKDVEPKAKKLKELLLENDLDIYLYYVSQDKEKSIEELL